MFRAFQAIRASSRRIVEKARRRFSAAATDEYETMQIKNSSSGSGNLSLSVPPGPSSATSPYFDTYELVKDLMRVGFSEQQALSVCHVLKSAARVNDKHMVTQVELAERISLYKQDLASLHAELALLDAKRTASRDIALANLRTEMERMQNNIIKFVVGLAGTLGALALGWKRLVPDQPSGGKGLTDGGSKADARAHKNGSGTSYSDNGSHSGSES